MPGYRTTLERVACLRSIFFTGQRRPRLRVRALVARVEGARFSRRGIKLAVVARRGTTYRSGWSMRWKRTAVRRPLCRCVSTCGRITKGTCGLPETFFSLGSMTFGGRLRSCGSAGLSARRTRRRLAPGSSHRRRGQPCRRDLGRTQSAGGDRSTAQSRNCSTARFPRSKRVTSSS